MPMIKYTLLAQNNSIAQLGYFFLNKGTVFFSHFPAIFFGFGDGIKAFGWVSMVE